MTSLVALDFHLNPIPKRIIPRSQITKSCELSIDGREATPCESNIRMLIHCSHGFPVQDGIVKVLKYGIFIEVKRRKARSKERRRKTKE